MCWSGITGCRKPRGREFIQLSHPSDALPGLAVARARICGCDRPNGQRFALRRRFLDFFRELLREAALLCTAKSSSFAPAFNFSRSQTGAGKRRVDGKSFRLADEVRYITRRAAHHDGRIVTIGQLTLFSRETGDAWIIDRDDHLALQLVRQGDPEPFHIEETDSSFAIDWKGHYRIEGAAFVYTDRDTGRITTVLGYPTNKLAPEA